MAATVTQWLGLPSRGTITQDLDKDFDSEEFEEQDQCPEFPCTPCNARRFSITLRRVTSERGRFLERSLRQEVRSTCFRWERLEPARGSRQQLPPGGWWLGLPSRGTGKRKEGRLRLVHHGTQNTDTHTQAPRDPGPTRCGAAAIVGY